MAPDDVHRFFAAKARSLPARLEWREVGRVGERRGSAYVSTEGLVSEVRLEAIIMVRRPEYLTIQLLAPTPICRLCMDGKHFDRKLGIRIEEPHFHVWPAGWTGARLPKELEDYEIVPPQIRERDAAFSWFLARAGIDSPPWVPVAWPGEGLLV